MYVRYIKTLAHRVQTHNRSPRRWFVENVTSANAEYHFSQTNDNSPKIDQKPRLSKMTILYRPIEVIKTQLYHR